MWNPTPSATKVVPISKRKLRASIFTVGWSDTKLPTASAEIIMTPTAKMTAATMTARSSAIPTAVITESNEKMMSNRAI